VAQTPNNSGVVGSTVFINTLVMYVMISPASTVKMMAQVVGIKKNTIALSTYLRSIGVSSSPLKKGLSDTNVTYANGLSYSLVTQAHQGRVPGACSSICWQEIEELLQMNSFIQECLPERGRITVKFPKLF